ncbi:hypothetical protein PHYBLDRAFT_161661 [Phycomyces blakesleeanus NRRL 1555(-)]|uniref:Uncharacterized protein n=1 Tax=Phycomyces blakesleeanus (strain ATCC 8743b / DSM 1359 / FGSC 10004 / NBRC 33097 / NRRL 1555) TaxID=763407 RepID=A0A167R7G9_PHYB8|nr:hypothetical protein PHYBLDRAFT_161661 [Phycomyces blakesleeanus NRRL 1555(-)]OAD81029.1 hypothetical protein PHYBLDRAFT_161661 [Phycomyces blakesleeanus NRRL 1555(-)]|eukprot:XP_018299069.1 hypothetical protein PHYBLDRAFT_161661 [Phycomyces blakesleeanus NRRL 1555(-)]
MDTPNNHNWKVLNEKFVFIYHYSDHKRKRVKNEPPWHSMKNLSISWKRTNELDDMNAHDLSKWHGGKKLKLIDAKIKIKQNEFDHRISTRFLYILKDQYIDDITRISLLNRMSVNLKEVFLVTKVLANVSCEVNQPLLARDSKLNTDMLSKTIEQKIDLKQMFLKFNRLWAIQ